MSEVAFTQRSHRHHYVATYVGQFLSVKILEGGNLRKKRAVWCVIILIFELYLHRILIIKAKGTN